MNCDLLMDAEVEIELLAGPDRLFNIAMKILRYLLLQ
jgi:hypothetical protein